MGSTIPIKNAELLRSIINSLATPVFIKDRDHKWILVNDAFCELMGQKMEDLIGKSDYDFFPKEEADVFWEKDTEVFSTRQMNINIEDFTDSDQVKHIIETKKIVFHNPEWGDVLCGVITDITELKKYQSELNALNQDLQRKVESRTRKLKQLNMKLEKMAFVDKLTGLMSRSAFDELFQRYINDSGQNEQPFALLYLDIDDLKRINDSYGHPEGDVIIVEFGKILNQLFNGQGHVSRIGGDEFMILSHYNDKQEILDRIEHLITQLQNPIFSNKRKLFVSVSIGVAFYPDDAEDMVTMTQYADAAMYQAKKHSKGGFALHDKSFITKIRRKLEIEQQLRAAVEQQAIKVHYQPIYSINQDVIIGYEALARWSSEEFGEVSPDEFIAIAERSDLILSLGYQVLTDAVHFIKTHCDPNQYVSVNVSPVQLKRGQLIQHARETIESLDVNPHQLALEITESEMITLNNCIDDFKSCPTLKNIQFFVDDFGTGYSNLSQLKRLEFSALKIDRDFIKDLPDSRTDRSLVSTMISMASELNLKIIAEGVETEEQKSCLLSMGCELMQGFLMCEPTAFD